MTNNQNEEKYTPCEVKGKAILIMDEKGNIKIKIALSKRSMNKLLIGDTSYEHHGTTLLEVSQ